MPGYGDINFNVARPYIRDHIRKGVVVCQDYYFAAISKAKPRAIKCRRMIRYCAKSVKEKVINNRVNS